MALVNYVHNLNQNLPEVYFAFADILCNLKIKLKERYKNNFTPSFDLKHKLQKTLNFNRLQHSFC